MTDLNQIANEYQWGSQGFVVAVETHCGFSISRDEIQRIADRTATPGEFQSAWKNDDDWTDENNRAYTAEVFGSSWSRGPVAKFDTIDECRDFAESYGTTADSCTVTDADGEVVARFVRDRNGNGMDWFEAQI